MRRHQKKPHLHSILTSFSQLQLPSFILLFSPPWSSAVRCRMWGCGLYTTVHSCHCLLLLKYELFSETENCRDWIMSSVHHAYGLQLYHLESSRGHQFARSLLQHGLCTDHRVCSCRICLAALAWDHPWASLWIPAAPLSLPWATWEPLHHCLVQLLLLPFLWSWCLTFFGSSLTSSGVCCPFLNVSSWRHHQHC